MRKAMPVLRIVSIGLLTLAGGVPATPPAAATDVLPYLQRVEGSATPVEIDAPAAGTEADLKPPDWCEVPGEIGVGLPTGDLPDLPDPGSLGGGAASASYTYSQEEQDELNAIGPSGDGLGDTGLCPPDPTMAAGDSRLMLAVNSVIASYYKSPAHEWSITFKDWLTPLEEALTDESPLPVPDLIFFHPSLVYDDVSDRFMFTVAAVDETWIGDISQPARSALASFVIFGASQTSDPNGDWCVYGIPAVGEPHYPRIGYNSGYLFITNNEYPPFDAGDYRQANLYTVPKSEVLSCDAAPFRAFMGLKNADNTLAFGVQPPASGGPEPYYLVNTDKYRGAWATLWRVEDGEIDCEIVGNICDSRILVKLEPYKVLSSYQPTREPGCTPSSPEDYCFPQYLNILDARLRNAAYRDGELLFSQIGTDKGEVRVHSADLELCEAMDDDISKFPPHPCTTTEAFQASDSFTFNPSVMVRPDGAAAVTFNCSGANDTRCRFPASGTPYSGTGYPGVWAARRVGGTWKTSVPLKLSAASYSQPEAPGPFPFVPDPLLLQQPTPFSKRDGGSVCPWRWGESAGSSPDPDGSGIWVYNVYAAGGGDDQGNTTTWGTWLTRMSF